MAVWEYDDLDEMIGRQVAGDYTLSPAAQVLCLCALSQMEGVFDWIDGYENLTDEQRDTVDNWVATAYNDLLEAVECDECEEAETVQSASFWYEKAEDTAGDVRVGTEALNILNWSDDDDTNTEDLVGRDGQVFTPALGLYIVRCVTASYSVGRNRIGLYDEDDNWIAYGVQSTYTDEKAVFEHRLNVFETEKYYFTHECGQGGWGGAKKDNGPEYYHQCSWVRVGDAV